MRHKCPICKVETDSAIHADFPFCSERCRERDLGNWASEKYDGIPLAFTGVFFIEDWFGHHVFLAGPVAQVSPPAALAAKREVRVDRRVRLRFADGAFVLHRECFFSVFSVASGLRNLIIRSHKPQRSRKGHIQKKSISQPSTRRGAPVAMR